MTLTETINGIKKGEFKFDKLKSQLTILDGLMKGAIIVMPADAEAESRLKSLIDHDVNHEVNAFTKKPTGRITKNFQTVDTESLRGLLNEINEIL